MYDLMYEEEKKKRNLKSYHVTTVLFIYVPNKCIGISW